MMKIFKRVIIFLLFLTLAFFSLGFVFPYYSFDNNVTIETPLNHSFPVFTDISKMPKWLDGFKKIECISGLPFQVGSKWRLTLNKNGKDEEMIQTFTQFKKYEEFSFVIENEMMRNDVQILFKERNGKTLITIHNKMAGKNLFWRSVFVFFHPTMRNTQQKIYDALKKVVEETPMLGVPANN